MHMLTANFFLVLIVNLAVLLYRSSLFYVFFGRMQGKGDYRKLSNAFVTHKKYYRLLSGMYIDPVVWYSTKKIGVSPIMEDFRKLNICQ